MRQTLLLLLGWGFVALGAVQVLDDLVWGLLLLALGLYLLSFEQPWVRARRVRLESRYPEAAAFVARAEAKARALYAKATGTPPDDEPHDRATGGRR